MSIFDRVKEWAEAETNVDVDKVALTLAATTHRCRKLFVQGSTQRPLKEETKLQICATRVERTATACGRGFD